MSTYMQHSTKTKEGKVIYTKQVTITSEFGSLKFVVEDNSELGAYIKLLNELKRFSGPFSIDYVQSAYNIKQKIIELKNKG